MIKYKLDVQEELKKKGYTSYIIRKNKYLSEGTLAKIKRGEPINMKRCKWCNRSRNNRWWKNKIFYLKKVLTYT